MPFKIVFLRPPNWSQLKPFCYSTIAAIKVFGNGPDTVSGLTEFRGANSVSSFQPIVCAPFAELTDFAAELSEFSLPKQYSRNSIPPAP